MKKQLYVNNFKTVLALAASSSDTVIQVATGQGALLPALNNGDYILLTLEISGSVEIIKVTSISGDSLTVVRAQEGTSASFFPANSAVECRVTANTLAQFRKVSDTLAEVTGVAALVSPSVAEYHTALTGDRDDGTGPILAVIDSTANLWKFPSHSKKVIDTGAVSNDGTSTANTLYSSSTLNVTGVVPGKYILQFTSGLNAGICRIVLSAGSNNLTWTTPLSSAPSIGDTFDVYKSNISILTAADSVSDDALAYAIALGS